MKIVLPWPHPDLNPNRSKGAHWSRTAILRKEARHASYWIAREALVTHAKAGGAPLSATGLLRVEITFLTPTPRLPDLDNLLASLKPGLDGIADCLKTDDSKFDPITITRRHGGKPGSVVVEVHP